MVYVVCVTVLLNQLCFNGYENISWLIILLPYILMFILIIIAMFIVDKKKDEPKKDGFGQQLGLKEGGVVLVLSLGCWRLKTYSDSKKQKSKEDSQVAKRNKKSTRKTPPSEKPIEAN